MIQEPGDSAGTSLTITRTISPMRWVANAGYAILLIVMALIPPTTTVAGLSVPDWIAHAAAYGFQSGLLYWALSPMVGNRAALAGGFLGAVGFGLVTEGLQLLQPDRAVELRDVLANTAGAFLICGFTAIVLVCAARRVG